MALSELEKLIRQLDRSAIKLTKFTPTDEELADAVGTVRGIEVRLQGVRKRWETLTAEMDSKPVEKEKRADPNERAGRPVAVGKDWELVPTWKTERSYNSARILVDMQAGLSNLAGGADVSLAQVINTARERDVVRLNWQWSKLKAFFGVLGVDLEIADEEIEDDANLDAPHVGELRRQAGVQRVPLKEGRR